MREAFAEMTGADPLTALSVSDVCLPFLADLGEDSWQTGTGLNTDEIIVEVTMAVDPARVWKALLEPTLDEIFDMPKGGKERLPTSGVMSSFRTRRSTTR